MKSDIRVLLGIPLGVRAREGREAIVGGVSAIDRAGLQAMAAKRNNPQKQVWRARIVLLTVDALSTRETNHRTAKSKTAVLRWNARIIRCSRPAA